MKIIYGFSNCSNKKYNEIFSDKKLSVLRADQKYHNLLIKGLKKNGVDIECFSGLPINRSVSKKILINENDEIEDGVHYHYYKTVNLPVLRQLGIYFNAKKSLKKVKNDGKTFAICDCLNIANALGMVKSARRKKIPLIMIVTDIPEFQYGKKLQKFANKLLLKADGYIFLTEQMNEKINLNKKPYIVLEGHSDNSLSLIGEKEKFEKTTKKKIVVYAGSIQKLYGIQNLVEGFIEADIKDARLHIFGDGDYREELENVSLKYKNVKYMGIKNNDEVVFEEQRASLLVNPRPISPEYTKYSFPSKNMEYMVSGTPVLTTKLPGMPKEYYPYVYFIEDESPFGIAKSIKQVLDLSYRERQEKALNARDFVLKNKSNVVQSKKIISFLEENFND